MIHHGKANNRIYLMEYEANDQEQIILQLENLAEKNDYQKIVVKLPKSACKRFLDEGYAFEAEILKYYRGGQDCWFLSKFLTEERKKNEKLADYETVIQTAKSKTTTTRRPLEKDYKIVKLGCDKAGEIADLYQAVFPTYPFPVFDPSYIESTMKTHVFYFGIYYKHELVALSSSEVNEAYQNAEMTDFAINEQHRGKQLAKHLLIKMEQEMNKMGLKTLYTIARAESLPMNCTFSGLGYQLGGTLINNTQISGKIESMNIWYKNR